MAITEMCVISHLTGAMFRRVMPNDLAEEKTKSKIALKSGELL